MSDEVAIGMLAAAAELGLDVPGDVSVVGFDDITEAAHAHPSLTTVHQDLSKKGEVVTELLFDEHRTLPHVILPCTLVVRHSTGPVPQRSVSRHH